MIKKSSLSRFLLCQIFLVFTGFLNIFSAKTGFSDFNVREIVNSLEVDDGNITIINNEKVYSCISDKNRENSQLAVNDCLENVYVDENIAEIGLLLPESVNNNKNIYHLFSHGKSGELFIEGKWKNVLEIKEWIICHADIKKIKQVNIYGCEFAKGKKGLQAVSYLKRELGITISASDDITGKDGDWDLEAGTRTVIKGLESYKSNLQSISGTINSYASVTNISGTTFTVDATAGFTVGQKILVIQMQGATINTSNTSNYGKLVALNGAGNYEFATIQSVTATAVTITAPLTKTYDATGSVQLVTVPVYTGTTTVSAALTGTAWNGAKGGVLVFEADQLVLNNDITMSGKGFIGGARSTTSNNYTDYYSATGATKGQGIAKFTVGNRLSGAQYNGGGGGNAVNTGGGGGANFGTGGNGGTYSLNTQLSGRGGYAVSCGLRALIMGGGGGAGDENDNQGSAGANGGGIIMIRVNSITGNSRIIESNGNTAANSQSDGAGGGGAGGTFALLGTPVISGNLTISLKGGNGGTVDYVGAHGGGGGGGGGYFLRNITLPSTVALDVSGGAAGSYTAATPPPILAAGGQSGGVSTLAPIVPVVAGSQVFQYMNGMLTGVSDPGNTVVDLTGPGTANSFSITANDYVTINNSGQLSWIGTSAPPGDLVLYVTPNGDISGCPVSITVQYNNDNDSDGIRDIDDMDDDNDGVPDAVESSACFYTELETLNALKISSQFTNPDDSQTDGDIQVLHDGSPALSFNFSALTAAQNPTGSNLFTLEYPTPVMLSAISVSNDISSTANANAVVVGSNDGITWSAALSPATLITTTPINFTISTSQAYKYYRIQTGSVPGDLALANTIGEITTTYTTSYNASYHPKPNCITDTDGDGTRNEYDLDSDGDGCSDAFEAGATTSTTSNFTFTSAVGTNGLADVKETSADSGTINYISTYSQYGTSQALSLCADTDGDGVKDVADIDDDNDGILDVVESPVCFYTASEAIIPVKISTGITTSSVNSVAVILGNDIPTMHDGVTVNATTSNHVVPANQLGNTSKVIYKIQYPVAISLTQMDVYTASSNWGTGSFAVLEASNDDVNYTAVSVPVATSVGLTKVWPVTLNTTNLYRYYRIRVSTAAPSPLAFTNYEVVGILNSATYIPSANPKPANCTIDTDADGIPNHRDLDSDGDGCSDLSESGVSPSTDVSTPASATNNNGGSYGIAANRLAGSQLNPNAADANNDGLNDSVDADLNNIPDYSSTYSQYALAGNIAPCADSDGDGINDISDIDDDNDGIVDALESPSCFYTAAEVAVPQSVTTQIATTGTIANVYDNNVATTFAFTNGATKINLTIFEVTPPSPLKASTLYIRYSTATANALGTTAGSVRIDGWDGTSWITLQTYTPAAAAVNVQSFAIPAGSQATYSKYRLQGLSGTVTNAVITEVGLTASSDYIPSAHPKPTCTNDPDGDGIPNHLDLDSDGDGCSDLAESGVSPATDIITPSVTNNVGSSYGISNPAGSQLSPTAADSNNDGLNDSVDTDLNGVTNYTSTYSNAVNNSIAACTLVCYRPAVTSGTVLDTQQGITSLQRAGVISGNWPMVRKGAWTALESKTKGFVPNRLTAAQISAIPAANLVEGMMVYNIDSDCLYINTDGTATGWRCFNTQACP